jgi:hypothetical protein
LIVLSVLIACSTLNANRVGLQKSCNSDRDCLYGLVCRGAPVGESGDRYCVYDKYETCKSTEQCLPGRTCRGGACTVECVTDTDCLPLSTIRATSLPDAGKIDEDEYHCVVGECHTGKDDLACLGAADCSPGQECLAGRCSQPTRTQCVSDLDCASGERCVARMCE